MSESGQLFDGNMKPIDPDPKRGEQLRDEGMARVEQSSGPEWNQQAYYWSLKFLNSLEMAEFTSEHIRNFAYENGLPQPPDGRAWGPVMKKLTDQKIITPHGWTKSIMANCHAMPKRTYIRNRKNPKS